MVTDTRELVIELNAAHTITGHRYDDQVVNGAGEHVRTYSTWEYVCTCGELRAGVDAQTAMAHVAEVRGPGV